MNRSNYPKTYPKAKTSRCDTYPSRSFFGEFHHHFPRFIVVHKSARLTPIVSPKIISGRKYHQEVFVYHINLTTTIPIGNNCVSIMLILSRIYPFFTSQRSNKTAITTFEIIIVKMIRIEIIVSVKFSFPFYRGINGLY